MTNEELIDIACLWLDREQSSYVQCGSDGRLYVSGGCQTDLRAFLNKVKNGTKEQAYRKLGIM